MIISRLTSSVLITHKSLKTTGKSI